jgi:hypothetical protein
MLALEMMQAETVYQIVALRVRPVGGLSTAIQCEGERLLFVDRRRRRQAYDFLVEALHGL